MTSACCGVQLEEEDSFLVCAKCCQVYDQSSAFGSVAAGLSIAEQRAAASASKQRSCDLYKSLPERLQPTGVKALKTSSPQARQFSDFRSDQARRRLKEIGRHFKIPPGMLGESTNLLDRLIDDFQQTRLGLVLGYGYEVLAGVCVYVVIRQNWGKFSVELKDVAAHLGITTKEFGRCYSAFVKHAKLDDPALNVQANSQAEEDSLRCADPQLAVASESPPLGIFMPVRLSTDTSCILEKKTFDIAQSIAAADFASNSADAANYLSYVRDLLKRLVHFALDRAQFERYARLRDLTATVLTHIAWCCFCSQSKELAENKWPGAFCSFFWRKHKNAPFAVKPLQLFQKQYALKTHRDNFAKLMEIIHCLVTYSVCLPWLQSACTPKNIVLHIPDIVKHYKALLRPAQSPHSVRKLASFTDGQSGSAPVCSYTHDLNSEELHEDDLSAAEAREYLRSPEEIVQFEAIQSSSNALPPSRAPTVNQTRNATIRQWPPTQVHAAQQPSSANAGLPVHAAIPGHVSIVSNQPAAAFYGRSSVAAASAGSIDNKSVASQIVQQILPPSLVNPIGRTNIAPSSVRIPLPSFMTSLSSRKPVKRKAAVRKGPPELVDLCSDDEDDNKHTVRSGNTGKSCDQRSFRSKAKYESSVETSHGLPVAWVPTFDIEKRRKVRDAVVSDTTANHVKSASFTSAKGNPCPVESAVDLSKKLKPSSVSLASINRSYSGLGADYSSAAEDTTDADEKFEEAFKFSVRSIRVGTYRASTVRDFACTRRRITAVVEVDRGADAGISKCEAVNLSINFSQINSIQYTCTKQLYALFLDILPDCAEELRKTLGMPASMPNSDRENYFDSTSTHIYHKYFVVILDSLTSEEEATLKSILRVFEQQCPELRRSGVIPCRVTSYEQANELLRTTLAPHLMKDFETASPAKANRSSATHSTTVTTSSKSLNFAEASTSGASRGSASSKVASTTAVNTASLNNGKSVEQQAAHALPQTLVAYRNYPISKEDLKCLHEGEFLNDAIIDFYLAYLVHEMLPEHVREKTHLFSTYFWRGLTKKPNAAADAATARSNKVPDALNGVNGSAIVNAAGASTEISKVEETCKKRTDKQSLAKARHGNVRKWTKNVDLFAKDYIIIPVNEELHWYLVIICFPGNAPASTANSKKRSPATSSITVSNDTVAGAPVAGFTSNDSSASVDAISAATLGDVQPSSPRVVSISAVQSEGDSVPKKADAIATNASASVVDGLAEHGEKEECDEEEDETDSPQDSASVESGSKEPSAKKTYLTAEWAERKKSQRIFDGTNLRGIYPKLPQQANYTDCGVFVLQYAEKFFEDLPQVDIPLGDLSKWFDISLISKKRTDLNALILSLSKKQSEACSGSK